MNKKLKRFLNIIFNLFFPDKKKAPAPPPRTVSANLSGHPIATPRNAMSKLSIVEDAQDEMIIDETHKCNY